MFSRRARTSVSRVGNEYLGGARLSHLLSRAVKQSTGFPPFSCSMILRTSGWNPRATPTCLHLAAAFPTKRSNGCKWSSSRTNAVNYTNTCINALKLTQGVARALDTPCMLIVTYRLLLFVLGTSTTQGGYISPLGLFDGILAFTESTRVWEEHFLFTHT